MEIIEFQKKYFDALVSFCERHYPNKKNIQKELYYNLFVLPKNSEGYRKNLLILDNGKIIGIQLYIPTQVFLEGNYKETLWGYNTLVEPAYRKTEAGLELILHTNKLKGFGCGLSEINKKIQIKLKNKFIGQSYLFIHFNIYFYKVFLNKFNLLLKQPENFIFPTQIHEVANTYKQVMNVEDLNILNNGYWNKDQLNTDFIRDREFIKRRFILHYKKYYIYQSATNDVNQYAYLVVRPVLYKGINSLILVDYRFNINTPHLFNSILDATSRLSLQLKIPLVLTRCSVSKLNQELKRANFRKIGKGAEIVTNEKKATETMVTVADSDSEIVFS